MPARSAFVVLLTATFTLFASHAHGGAETAQWPAWRGVDGTGVLTEGNPPLHWSETENISWKTELPGKGQSTPIIWGNKIFLQTAEEIEPATELEKFPKYRFSVLGLDRTNGKLLWQTPLREARPHEGHHQSTTVAPFSPVTDGERLWASFGSLGLFCLDLDGNVLWEAKTIQMNKVGTFGEGSSPVLVGNSIIVLADHEGPSKLFSFDKNTGKTQWVVDRDTETSWGTPVAVQVGDRTEIITTAPGTVRSYNVTDGSLIWHCGGLTSCAAPSPVVSNGLVYATTGYKGEVVLAIKLGQQGDLTGTDALQWMVDSTGSEVTTPLVHKGRIYVFKSISSALSCYDAATGKPFYERVRVPGMKHVYASPLAVGDHIYINGREGTTVVINASDEFEVVASNSLEDTLDGSPVVIGDALYLRGHSWLYCIAE